MPHENIMQILRHGWLPGSKEYCYIDMPLCETNLRHYIFGPRATIQGTEHSDYLGEPVYIKEDCPEIIKLRNAFTIISHIAAGLEFMHTHQLVHRDVKPNNGNRTRCSPSDEVLYYAKGNVWKLADFGISTDATSSDPQTTRSGAGTPSY